MRLQPSWIIESVAEKAAVESVFFPFIHRFSALNWLSRKEIPLQVNTPVDSQAMLIRAWFDGSQGGFSDRNRNKFNQVIKNPLDLEMNPFKSWNERYFDRQQLDYLFYWREAAYEIDNEGQREIFWAIVYQVITYWLSNRRSKIPLAFLPDQLMHYILNRHAAFVTGKDDQISVSCYPLEELEAAKATLAVFPLVFADEETFETELQAVYHAWFHGHADIEKARKDIRIAMKKYPVMLGQKLDLELFVRLSARAEIAALTWSGNELHPQIYEQELVNPFREALAGKFARSKLSLKAVDKEVDSYDYLLLFFN